MNGSQETCTAGRAWLGSSWNPWVRYTTLSAVLMAMTAVSLTFFEQPLVLVIAGSIAGTSPFRMAPPSQHRADPDR